MIFLVFFRTFLLVCIRMYSYVPVCYSYVGRILLVCKSYVSVYVCTRMFRMLLVCHSYVTRMYWCGVLVMIIKSAVR